MNISELREKSAAELQTLLNEKRHLLQEKSFKVSEAQLAQIHTIKEVKRDIARILTILSDMSAVAAQ